MKSLDHRRIVAKQFIGFVVPVALLCSLSGEADSRSRAADKTSYQIGREIYGQYPVAAIPLFSKALEENPQFADAYYLRAVCFFSTAKTKEAASDVGKAIALNGRPEYYLLALMIEQREGNKSAAESYANDGLSLCAVEQSGGISRNFYTWLELLLERAKLREARGDLVGAVADWDACLKKVKKADVYFQRGRVKQKMNRLEEAIADFQIALDIYRTYDPRNPNVESILATLQQLCPTRPEKKHE
jgi:tetratricopeptide (TPR) repeat protein